MSLAIHGALVLLAGLIVFGSRPVEEPVDFISRGEAARTNKADEKVKAAAMAKRRAAMGKRAPMSKVIVDRPNPDRFLEEKPLELVDLNAKPGGDAIVPVLKSDGGVGDPFGSSLGSNALRTWVAPPKSMTGRCSASERLQRIRDAGGSSECELAVTKSLAWLKGKQNEDGSWGRANKGAMTGLALLCYLGRCETPDSPFYGDNVMRGILFLIALGQQNPHGIMSADWEGGTSSGGVYEHGIATYALGELYALTRLGEKSLPGMREAFEKGVRVIIENQKANGSWTYGGQTIVYDRDGNGDDLSVAGWQYQALKAAKNTGLKIAGLDVAIDKTVRYLLTKQTKDGGFGRANRDEHYNQWSLSGCGILGLQTLGKGANAKEITKGMKFLREFLQAEPLDWNRNCNLYCWYYYTQAFFQSAGADWKLYNEMFLPQMLTAQKPDGSFTPGRANWPAGDAADEVYRQTLCTLQLEVYYRYLKVADREDGSIFEKGSARH